MPGDPAATDRTFGPLGGLEDDVHFWEKDRQRNREIATARLAAEARPIRSNGRFSRLRRWLARSSFRRQR